MEDMLHLEEILNVVSKFSKQNIYSTKATLGVKSVSVKKLHGYGHLEEIVVKRSNQQLYKFKETERRRTKESESSKKLSFTKETLKGKTSTKGSKTDNQPQDTLKPKKRKTLNPDWFKQPPRPPTPDPEWNKRQVILDKPAQPCFNQMVSALKDPLIFNDLMATPIDFSKNVLNGLKISYENTMDKGVANTIKDHKRKHDNDEDDDDEDPPTGPNQGKKTERRRTKESESSKKLSFTKETLKGKTSTKGSKTDGTIKSVRDEIHYRILEFCLDYNKELPKRK
nr:hypothetical protein [Tanacetum cinerariifolium]